MHTAHAQQVIYEVEIDDIVGFGYKWRHACQSPVTPVYKSFLAQSPNLAS
jgi:hypothetical protein